MIRRAIERLELDERDLRVLSPAYKNGRRRGLHVKRGCYLMPYLARVKVEAIAAFFGIAPDTLRTHYRRTLRRFGARDKAHLALILAMRVEPLERRAPRKTMRNRPR